MNLSSFPYRKLILIVVVISALTVLALRYVPVAKIFRVSASAQQSGSKEVSPGREVPNSLLFDFEVPAGKEIPSGIEKGLAHSGSYAMKAYGKNTFTPAIERKASELGLDKMKAIAVSAWVYVKPTKHQVDGVLVFSASNELGVNICWKGASTKDPGVPREKWFKMSSYFDLSDIKIKPDTRIQIYFWNNSSCDMLVDDIYLVMGGPYQRQGDTGRVDLTKNAWEPKLNVPPFPVTFLYRNDKQTPNIRPDAFGDGCVLLAGNFRDNGPGPDQLFVTDASGRAFIYAYCRESGSFETTNISGSALLKQIKPGSSVLAGKFISNKPEQMLFTTSQTIYLCQLENIPPCAGEAYEKARMKVIWQSEKLAGTAAAGIKEMLATDLNGDGLAELSVVDREGNFMLLRFRAGSGSQQGEWEKISPVEKGTIPEWDPSVFDFRIFAGRFLHRSQEQLLTVFTQRQSGKTSYSVRSFASGKLNPHFPSLNGNAGITVGRDTLKQGDEFFFIRHGTADRILWLNRNWRFDLKEIGFNDTTFVIRSNIDFKGYADDHNPKYYGWLRLVPGCFLQAEQTTILAIGRNYIRKDGNNIQAVQYPELPGFVDLYSFSNPKSK